MELSDFVSAARQFSDKLAQLKRDHPPEQFGWYPYDSLTAVSVFERLLERDFHLVAPLIQSEPVLDAGCADGDLAFFFESLGATVDAIDYSEMNFNQLRGAHAIKDLLQSCVNIRSINLDWYFELPRVRYGLILFLGTLYHLKNPFYVLERFARAGAYCLLSTRVAQRTPGDGVNIRNQPLAYLLDPRETNDDSTNFWIFSEAGLLRLVDRTGWSLVNAVHVGRLEDSNPVDPEADERMFLLLKSRIRYPEMHISLLEGWHPVESAGWRWTAKAFSFRVVLPKGRRVKEFALAFTIPEAVLAAGGDVTLSCEVNGASAGAASYSDPGTHTFRGVFPEGTGEEATIRFLAQHGFAPPAGDERDLGVMISFADELAGGRSGLPFRIS